MFTFGSEKQHRILVLTYTCAQLLSHVQLFETPWTVTRQAPLSMGFSRQEAWSGLPLSLPRDLPDPGIESESSAFQRNSLLLNYWGSPDIYIYWYLILIFPQLFCVFISTFQVYCMFTEDRAVIFFFSMSSLLKQLNIAFLILLLI